MTYIFKKLQHFQVINQSIIEPAILSANNMLKFLHPIHQQKSLISVKFRCLICRKLELLVLQLQEQHQKHALLSSFFDRKSF